MQNNPTSCLSSLGLNLQQLTSKDSLHSMALIAKDEGEAPPGSEILPALTKCPSL